MVHRIYVEKKPGLRNEADALFGDLKSFLAISSLTALRLLNRYDVENIDEALFERAVGTVFSEPQLDTVTAVLPDDGAFVFAVSYLPGQFDQRADSAEQCIRILDSKAEPTVRTAKVYRLFGDLTEEEIAAIKRYVINPVESHEVPLDKPKTLKTEYEIPTEVETLTGFTALSDGEAAGFVAAKGLAMDEDDVRFCRDYFRSEHRDPTITEIRVIDTYWSDHCRHTTFLTRIDDVSFDDPLLENTYRTYLDTRRAIDRKKPITLMDIGTIAASYLRKQGKLDKLDVSDEINACTVKITVTVDGRAEPWLLLFKNETHNHPTEIEPFGGAATCIGGAIRDPLSGRSYVYGAMRVTGAADPRRPIGETLPGKLPQRKIVTTAAAGYSSYGNQIGLATGQVDELYHDGYAAKRMEIGAVIAAAPADNVRRETPAPGDVVILLGGRTGRDGCGGATGSSKSHNVSSLATCGAEVQKGNAPVERKLQRLFRDPEASRLIKRCNDFGAGGVSVAIGELADGLLIDLNAVPKKYDGLDGTELAISESQERMAVVVAPEDAARFLKLADRENLEATKVAEVTAEPRLVMLWNGKKIVDIARSFLDSNGAEKHITIRAASPKPIEKTVFPGFAEAYTAMAGSLACCSRRGLSERFDSTIGAGTVLMPFGGKNQSTPVQAMVQKISLEKGHTDDCSLMAWGFDPIVSENSPYHGAYLAVVESASKLIAAGASFGDVYLSFQEYFEKPRKDPERWGKPLSALLGAFQAQIDLGIAAIGGKDSMSGSFEDLDVPPTLVSFAVTTAKTGDILTNSFRQAGSRVWLLSPDCRVGGLPDAASLIAVFRRVRELNEAGAIRSAYTLGPGGAAEAVMKMGFGNGLGFAFESGMSDEALFERGYGSFVLELTDGFEAGQLLGIVTNDGRIRKGTVSLSLDTLYGVYENTLESVYPTRTAERDKAAATYSFPAFGPSIKAPRPIAKPRVIIPVFPGTNCEYDSARAFADAGAHPEIFVINNKSPEGIASSVKAFAEKVRGSQIVFLPGGFSGGDEPDGSGKFITAFFRNPEIGEAVTELLDERKGLMAGICNGFQALIKLGLVPFGRITEPSETAPTLTFNMIGRHQSRLVRTRIASTLSPWLAERRVGDVVTVPISHGEGRFLATEEQIADLAEKGQIATQYVDFADKATYDVRFNPNGSVDAVEGITSPDGRVFGKMGHSERIGDGLYRNVEGDFDLGMFRSAVRYYS